MAVWFVILIAVLAANAPFVSQRMLLIFPPRPGAAVKGMWMRLFELVVLYILVGVVARALESQAGQIAPQAWEFYAITATLFVTLAFPGFVYRYLFKHRG